MFLFFDTETTGLPQRWNAPVTNVDNWPRLVQLAWIMCDDKGNIIEERSDIIKPEGFSIPVEASRVHGITTIKAQEEGKDLLSILELFSDKIDAADALIGHNISFDECIVGAEFERKRMMTSLFLKPKYCTMKMSTNYCKLPGGKQDSSLEIIRVTSDFIRGGIRECHDALADVRATVRCFWKLKS
ncbi:MAG: 3'-5' exonuclease [Butyricimonas faecalis]